LRAVGKGWFEAIAAPGTVASTVRGGGCRGTLVGRRNRSTAITDHHRFPSFDRKERDEEETQVVIDPPEPALGQATGPTQAGPVVECDGPGLDPTDEKKHRTSLFPLDILDGKRFRMV